jgi:hypothetical protein
MKQHSSTYKATVMILTVAFLLIYSVASAQSQVVLNRLCKSWSLNKIVNLALNTSETAPPGFKLVIRKDHTLSQGMFPDGIIESTWQLEEQTMTLIITDVKTKFVTKLKILRITTVELQIQESESDTQTVIYYTADKEE